MGVSRDELDEHLRVIMEDFDEDFRMLAAHSKMTDREFEETVKGAISDDNPLTQLATLVRLYEAAECDDRRMAKLEQTCTLLCVSIIGIAAVAKQQREKKG